MEDRRFAIDDRHQVAFMRLNLSASVFPGPAQWGGGELQYECFYRKTSGRINPRVQVRGLLLRCLEGYLQLDI